MKRSFALLLTLALATPPGAFAGSGAPAKAALEKPEASDEAEARALKVAEVKLAALAREVTAANPDTKEAKAPAAKKKQSHSVHKKGRGKSRGKGHPKGDPAGQKVVNRRLTEGEVKAILKTTRDFSGSDLSGMNLVGMDLSGVKFNRANLHLANLERADLAETDLELADLTGANLRGASLNQARLRGTRMEGSRMDGALWIDKTVCKSGSVGGCIE